MSSNNHSYSNHVVFFDTTLRDGEQSPGCSMTTQEKLTMAHALEDLGVDIIEAGFAMASEGDFAAIATITQAIRKPRIASLARAKKEDIEMAARALQFADRARIHVFLASSDLHLEYKLKIGRAEALELCGESVRLARSLCDDVEFSPEDSTRSDRDFLVEMVGVAVEAGATTINMPDTVGYSTPEEYGGMFREVRERIPAIDEKGVILSSHCHDDLGLAVANSLAAITAGARQVECTINGIGERAGNAALEEIVMALRTRHDSLPVKNGIATESILRTSKLLATITGFDVQPNKAIVGRNAFAHESGIHQDGVLKNAATYEIMTPESVGLQKNSLVMGKHSGRAAFRDKLSALGYGDLGDNSLNDAFRRFKDLADRKKIVYDDDIVALVDDEVMRDHQRIKFLSLELWAGSKTKPKALLELEIDGQTLTAEATGDGPVDATFNAIRSIFPHQAELRLFSVGAVTEGTDAQAKCSVRLEESGKLVDGQGADTDTIVAAARAYIHALNKLLVKRTRTEPAALSAEVMGANPGGRCPPGPPARG